MSGSDEERWVVSAERPMVSMSYLYRVMEGGRTVILSIDPERTVKFRRIHEPDEREKRLLELVTAVQQMVEVLEHHGHPDMVKMSIASLKSTVRGLGKQV